MNEQGATAGRPPPRRKRFSGVVISAGKMTQTVTVAVERVLWHPKVRKQLRRVQTFLVHDAKAETREGDRVVIEETRPLSKRKHFRVVAVVSRSGGTPP